MLGAERNDCIQLRSERDALSAQVTVLESMVACTEAELASTAMAQLNMTSERDALSAGLSEMTSERFVGLLGQRSELTKACTLAGSEIQNAKTCALLLAERCVWDSTCCMHIAPCN